MLRTLYSKLALTLLLLVTLLGIIWFQGLSYTSEMYQQEVAQKLNHQLAQHLVAETSFFEHDKINRSTLEQLFHTLMVINPAIELYLLDMEGNILVSFAPGSKVELKRVDLAPVKQYISGNFVYPLLGDSPRQINGQKVFSAAPIADKGKQQGYLYIILAGEEFDTVAQQLKGSYILRNSISGLIASFLLILLMGFVAFAILTKRLNRLTGVINRFSATDYNSPTSTDFKVSGYFPDEIDQLAEQFNSMAIRIRQQIEDLNEKDNMRRELVANVSHDLRTPIASLLGYLETLIVKKISPQDAQYESYLKIAMQQGERLNQLVNELFELAKLDSCESILYSEPFSLAELITDVAQKFILRAKEKGIELRVTCSSPLGWVNADIGMIQRVLENLLENAIRHTPRGGVILVGFSADESRAIVRVEDSGSGIPDEETPHIFERFYQVDKSRSHDTQSAGLGLAIVKRILELHGSNIEVNSKLNQGTVFSFPMPLYTRI